MISSRRDLTGVADHDVCGKMVLNTWKEMGTVSIRGIAQEPQWFLWLNKKVHKSLRKRQKMSVLASFGQVKDVPSQRRFWISGVGNKEMWLVLFEGFFSKGGR